MQKCWSLYNKEEKLRIDDLRIDQVRTILLAIPSSRTHEWYACREGDLHWQSLSDVPDFYEDAMTQKGHALPAPKKSAEEPTQKASAKAPRRPLFEEGVDDPETTLQVEAVVTKERRTARRYVRNLQFVMSAGSVKFECETKEISMTGLSLKEKLPAGTPKSFRAELKLSGATVRFLANKVSDTSLKIVEADAWDVLRNWIVSW